LIKFNSKNNPIADFIQITHSGFNFELCVDITRSARFGAYIVSIIVGVTGLTNEAAFVEEGTLIT